MPRIGLVTAGILVALALVVAALRFYRLSDIPPGLYHDEGAHGVDALRVLQGEHAVFFPENSGREGLIVYAVAPFVAVLGRTMLALRLPMALASAGTVFALFWLGQVLFGKDEESGRPTPWRGLLIGGAAAGMLAVSLSQTILGRNAFRINLLPLTLALCLALLWSGWRQRSWWRIGLAGALAGLSVYTYMPARITPVLFLLFGITLLAPFRPGISVRLRAELPKIGIFAGAAALVGAPILIHFALHPDHLLLRSSQLWLFDSARSHGEPWGKYLQNVWLHILAIGIRGDLNWRHNFPGQPLLSPWETLFFLVGVGVSIWRWQRPANRLLLLWLVLLALPATLAFEGVPASNTIRMFGATTAIYLLAAVGMWETFLLLKRRWSNLAVGTDLFSGKHSGRAAIGLAALLCGLILGQSVYTYRTYFEKWANAPELYAAYHVEWGELAQALNVLPSDESMVYLVPRVEPRGFYSLEYLYRGEASVQVTNPLLPNLPQEVEANLSAVKDLSTAIVLDWNASPWHGDEEEPIAILLSRYGRYVGNQNHAGLQILTFSDITLDRPWRFYERLEPLPIVYDGGITLLGFALGQSERQLPAEEIVNLGTARSFWAVLQLETAGGLEIDYVMSLRLHDAGGARVFQEDEILLDSLYTHTSRWKAEEPVENLFHLKLPADLAPGEYELRLVIYESDTKKPSAQLDIWNTEILLARLQLAEIQ
ncbi:MAG: hypothetical protein OXI52_08755 [Caldilineaceae bacterium]|nr:hypothetical protein [Caldilineaceae bacterium]